MNKEFPLYPELPEAGNEEAQKLIDKFKDSMKSAANEAIGEFYCDVAMYIESDSWTNYRNNLLDGLSNYGNRLIQGDHDFKRIRQAIYKEYRDEIIVDLNQDIVKENESLKETIEFLQRAR